MKKLTTEEFIRRSTEVHGERYKYDQTTYLGKGIKVKIYCNQCKEYFKQLPDKHYNGSGCLTCARKKIGKKKRYDTKYFIEKSKEKHGDQYGYDKVIYTTRKSMVEIYCKKHEGYFTQEAGSHMRGYGCKQCSIERNASNRRKSQEEFIEEAKQVHNNKYDYSKTIYNGERKMITIICNKHGEFIQSPRGHLNGQGCPECANQLVGEINKLTTETFIKKALEKHGDKYDYTKTNYTSTFRNVVITCKKHGDFKLPATQHLQGSGCRECFKESVSIRKKSNTKDFIKKALEIHGDKYGYDKVNYETSNSIIEIFCKKHNDYFPQEAAVHLKGHGCPVCNKGAFDPTKPGLLYFFEYEGIYKIGITNHSIKLRYKYLSKEDFKKINVIYEGFSQDGFEIKWAEAKVIKEYKSYLNDKEHTLKGVKNSEVFNKNIYEINQFKTILNQFSTIH